MVALCARSTRIQKRVVGTVSSVGVEPGRRDTARRYGCFEDGYLDLLILTTREYGGCWGGWLKLLFLQRLFETFLHTTDPLCWRHVFIIGGTFYVALYNEQKNRIFYKFHVSKWHSKSLSFCTVISLSLTAFHFQTKLWLWVKIAGNQIF
jgi:hypothetical protein